MDAILNYVVIALKDIITIIDLKFKMKSWKKSNETSKNVLIRGREKPPKTL